MRFIAAILIATFVSPGVVHAEALDLRSGLWEIEVTKESNAPSVESTSENRERCITQDDKNAATENFFDIPATQQESCEIINESASSDSLTYEARCSMPSGRGSSGGETSLHVDADFAFNETQMSGAIDVDIDGDRLSLQQATTIEGRHVSDECPEESNMEAN